MFLSPVLFAALALAFLPGSPLSFPHSPYVHHARATVANFTEEALEVDLGYSIYKGWHNASAHLNNFQG